MSDWGINGVTTRVAYQDAIKRRDDKIERLRKALSLIGEEDWLSARVRKIIRDALKCGD